MTILTLRLESMAHGGDAVGHNEGKAIFVPLALPGELVRVRLTQDSKRFARAELLEVLEPSPQRVEAPCRYFGLCGGCQWQHIAYPAQLEYKRQIVIDALRHLGGQAEPLVRPTLGMEEPWGYRNHIQLQVDAEGRVGFHALGTHDVVPVQACWITHALLDDLWGALDIDPEGIAAIVLRAGVNTEEGMVILEGRSPEPPELEVDAPISILYQHSEDELVVLAGSLELHEKLRDRSFQISGPSFFQVNTLQAEELIAVVERYLDPQPTDEILDAYCGVGTFGLSLAGRVSAVVGIESSCWSLADAYDNLQEENVTLVHGTVEEVLPPLDASFDAIVLDPPRAGCTPAALEAVARCQPRRIVYVSCDPATLARDIRLLGDRGYSLVEVQPVDMFPQNFHVECVALVERIGES